MRTICALIVALAPLCADTVAPTDGPPANPQGILALIKGSALRYEGEVPDFTCTEMITRSEASGKAAAGAGIRWKVHDRLEEVLSFVEGHENHTLITVNGRPTRYTHDSLEGMRSDGLLQFVMVPNWIFGPQAKTRFNWVRWDTLNGGRMAVFTFDVPPSVSTRPLVNEEQAFIVGYHGLVFADPETGEMARLEATMDAPKDFPFQEDSFEIDYGTVHISNEQFLLPVRATGQLRDGKLLTKNEIEFTDYRKYEADVTVTFGDPSQP